VLTGESAIVNTLSQLSPFPNSQDSLGYLVTTPTPTEYSMV
jgi:hypothetical protein